MESARQRRPRAPGPAGARSGTLARGLPAGFAGLQRAAGNRAVGQLLRAPSIRVRAGSKLTAAELAAAISGNKHVPDWLRKGFGAKGDALTAGRLAAPKDKIWLFIEPLLAAFKSGVWDITTATSKITVSRPKGKGEPEWRQEVFPDLRAKEHLGGWSKIGPDELGFSPTRLHSESAEVIYGWTSPNEATTLSKDKRNVIVVVREIEVTAPNGKTRTFSPSPDNMAEAILHEIAIHAGRIAQGLPDTHDETSAVISELVDQIGAFFRAEGAGGQLERSPLTKEILAFVAAN